jgi:tetratricopeptide (TPR) repeat protein
VLALVCAMRWALLEDSIIVNLALLSRDSDLAASEPLTGLTSSADRRLLYHAGREAYERDEFAEAVNYLQLSAQSTHRPELTAYWLGLSYYELDSLRLAEKELMHIPNLGEFLVRKGREADLRLAVLLDPWDVEARLRLGDLYWSTDRQRAVVEYQSVATHVPVRAEGLMANARVFESEGRWSCAVQEYERSIQHWPQDGVLGYHGCEPYERISDLYQNRLGNSEMADRWKATAAATFQDYLWAQMSFCATFERSGDDTEEIPCYESVAERFSSSPWPHISIGLSLGRVGRFLDSLPHLERAIELDPSYAWSRFYLARHLARLGRYGLATAELSRASASSPGDVNVLYNVALVYEDVGDLNAAAEAYRRILSVNPEHGTARERLAELGVAVP